MEEKNKMINKIISIVLIIIIVTSTVNICYASVEITSVSINKKQQINAQYTYNGVRYMILMCETEDKIPVYSMNTTNTGENFNTNISIYDNEMLKNILKNGFNGKNEISIGCANKVEAFMATQEAIYMYNETREIGKYVIDQGRTARLLDVAQRIIENANKEPSNVLEIKECLPKWKQWEQDANYKYMEYIINSSNEEIGSIKITNGNDVKIIDWASKEQKQEFNNGDKFYLVVPNNETQVVNVKLSYKKDGTLLYMAKQGNEEYVLAEPGKETIEREVNVEIDGHAKVKIINQDSKTNEPIIGNVFSIIKDNNMFKENLISDENGEINIRLDNGKYYLKQTEAIEEYSKNKVLTEIEITDDTQNIQIKVNGTKESTEENTNKNKEINVTEETQNIVENNVTEVSNIHVTNKNKEIINTINETNLHNVNNFINTINRKNILYLEKENIYENYIKDADTIAKEVLIGDNTSTRMRREDYINYMDMIMLDSAKVPILPVASK